MSPSVDTVGIARLSGMVNDSGAAVTLVNVWATWCKPCQKELPDLAKLKKQYDTLGLRVILVSMDEYDLIGTEIPQALNKAGIDFTTYLSVEPEDEVFINAIDSGWNGALPATFLFDRTGTLTSRLIGERSFSEFEEAILPLLNR